MSRLTYNEFWIGWHEYGIADIWEGGRGGGGGEGEVKERKEEEGGGGGKKRGANPIYRLLEWYRPE